MMTRSTTMIAIAGMTRSTMAKKFGRNAVNYALFEALAEQKRHGLRKADLLRILFSFPPVFAINEMRRRKRAAKAEISDCRRVAVTLGLVQTGGSTEFPIFERKADEAVCG